MKICSKTNQKIKKTKQKNLKKSIDKFLLFNYNNLDSSNSYYPFFQFIPRHPVKRQGAPFFYSIKSSSDRAKMLRTLCFGMCNSQSFLYSELRSY